MFAKMISSEEKELLKTKQTWSRALSDCVKADMWGQVVEAQEAYQQLAADLRQKAPALHVVDELRTKHVQMQPKDAFILENILLLVEARSESFANRSESESNRNNNVQYPTKEDMEKLPAALEQLFVNEFKYQRESDFPIAMGGVLRPSGFTRPLFGQCSSVSTRGVPEVLSRRQSKQEGSRYLTLVIEKIGLKDAQTYARPCVHVSVYDASGELLENKQQTQVARRSERYYVCFDTKVIIQTPVSELEKAGASIFLEFVHYKFKGQRYSTRCWFLLEMDEIDFNPRQDGLFQQKLLQIYRKPMDVHKKKIHLHSIKKLYAHVRACVHE